MSGEIFTNINIVLEYSFGHMNEPERTQQAGEFEVEHTLLILKPDAVEQDICLHVLGRIVHGIEQGRIRASRILRLTPEVLRQHYAHLDHEPFYPRIEQFMLQSEVDRKSVV